MRRKRSVSSQLEIAPGQNMATGCMGEASRDEITAPHNSYRGEERVQELQANDRAPDCQSPLAPDWGSPVSAASPGLIHTLPKLSSFLLFFFLFSLFPLFFFFNAFFIGYFSLLKFQVLSLFPVTHPPRNPLSHPPSPCSSTHPTPTSPPAIPLHWGIY